MSSVVRVGFEPTMSNLTTP